MANVKNNVSAQGTRRKLIEAAGEVFSRRGLHAATLREITDLAGVNAAAVNYHFRDKYELYAAVIRRAVDLTPWTPREQHPRSSPESRLRAFIREAIMDVHDPSRPAWRSTLLSHELNQPTAAMEAIMDELIWPRVRLVRGLIRDILGPRASEEKVARGAFSVMAQLSHYLYNVGLLRRIAPDVVAPENAERIAEHIADFSLAGLRAMRRQRTVKDQHRRQRTVQKVR